MGPMERFPNTSHLSPVLPRERVAKHQGESFAEDIEEARLGRSSKEGFKREAPHLPVQQRVPQIVLFQAPVLRGEANAKGLVRFS
jgi:hypothetical protein